MNRVAIVAEGPTEEEFVKGVIAPHLRTRGVGPNEVDRKISRSYDQSRVFPYVQRYEFEALLFSDVTVFDELRDGPPDMVAKLKAIRSSFDTPEDIDDSEYTHPSRRIEDLMPSYHKRVDGPVLAGRMGLSTIRAECRGFNEWVTRLESLESTVRGAATGQANAG